MIQERNSTDDSNGRIADGRGLDSACTAKGKFKAVTAGSSKLLFYEPCSVCFPDGGDGIPEDKTVVYRPSRNTDTFHRPESDDVDVGRPTKRDGQIDYQRIADDDFDIGDLELGGRE